MIGLLLPIILSSIVRYVSGKVDILKSVPAVNVLNLVNELSRIALEAKDEPSPRSNLIDFIPIDQLAQLLQTGAPLPPAYKEVVDRIKAAIDKYLT